MYAFGYHYVLPFHTRLEFGPANPSLALVDTLHLFPMVRRVLACILLSGVPVRGVVQKT